MAEPSDFKPGDKVTLLIDGVTTRTVVLVVTSHALICKGGTPVEEMAPWVQEACARARVRGRVNLGFYREVIPRKG